VSNFCRQADPHKRALPESVSYQERLRTLSSERTLTGLAKLKERKDKIALTAGRLFARQGYHGTSTHEIARLAGIAENTLFRNFESKENLFWASLRLNLAGWSPRPDLLEVLDANADLEVVLPRFVAQVVDSTLLNPELLRLMVVAFIERRSKAMEVCRESLSPLLAALNRYLTVHIEESRLKGLDPALIAGAIVTMAWMHPVLLEFADEARAFRSNERDTIRVLSKFWIEALARPSEIAQP
jgi:AcrR family transcriptional regulator